jgi:hypothetical protein
MEGELNSLRMNNLALNEILATKNKLNDELKNEAENLRFENDRIRNENENLRKTN